MLIISRIIFAVIVLLISGYGLITKNSEVHPYMMLFLGLMMLVMGLDEFKKGRKGRGLISIMLFLLLLYTSIQGFILN